MRFKSVTQIILILAAIAMVFFVIKPKLAEVTDKQEETKEYQQAVDRATQYNNRLAQLVDKASSFPRADLNALDTYLPDRIDVLKVSEDLEMMVSEYGLLLENIEVGTDEETVTASGMSEAPMPNAVTDPALGSGTDSGVMVGSGLLDEAKRSLVSRQFNLSVLGTYEQFKGLLMAMEANQYPMRIVEMSFAVSSDSDLTPYTMTIETYALLPGNN